MEQSTTILNEAKPSRVQYCCTLLHKTSYLSRSSAVIVYYYIDRCELWGFIREINSGIFKCENISFFSSRNYFCINIRVVVTSLVVLQ